MSLGQTRLCNVLARGYILSARQPNLVACSSVEGQRFLTTHPQYKKPFPYQTKQFTFAKSLLEYTCARINENSRIIMIEGPPCVGKTEFAKQLALNFKLKYLPAITEEDLFVENGLDLRQLNDLMPSDKMRAYDLDMFYAEPDPKNMIYFGKTQFSFFKARVDQYINALRHVLHTGQGVVMENSVWSDSCYAMTLADLGYISRKAMRWYMDYRQNCLTFLWKPHLVINLDAPSSVVVKKMKEKNPKYENSPVLKESYIDLYRQKFSDMYLPYMRRHCDVLYYDIRELEDLDLLFMDLENMDLISARFGESLKFQNWKKKNEEQWSMYRYHLSHDTIISNMISWRSPYDVPELVFDGEELAKYMQVREKFPQLQHHYSYWHDKEGNNVSRIVEDELTPLSLATDYHVCLQGKPTRQISA